MRHRTTGFNGARRAISACSVSTRRRGDRASGVRELVGASGRTLYDRRMSLSRRLSEAPGVYFGTGVGPESGPFVSRITVSALPNGGVAIDYEATSRQQGVQHLEHSLLVSGPDGNDQLFIAHSESPFVTLMSEREPGSGRFEQVAQVGPYTMAVVIESPARGEPAYAWWWAMAGETPTEQSRATVALARKTH